MKRQSEHKLIDAILKSDENEFEIRYLKDKGRAVFSQRVFEKDDFVLEYVGKLRTFSEARKCEKIYSTNQSLGCFMFYFKYLCKSYCIDATDESRRLGRLVNHSRQKNNLTPKIVSINGYPRLILIANRRIEVGEELLYDYGDRSPASLRSHPWLSTMSDVSNCLLMLKHGKTPSTQLTIGQLLELTRLIISQTKINSCTNDQLQCSVDVSDNGFYCIDCSQILCKNCFKRSDHNSHRYALIQTQHAIFLWNSRCSEIKLYKNQLAENCALMLIGTLASSVLTRSEFVSIIQGLSDLSRTFDLSRIFHSNNIFKELVKTSCEFNLCDNLNIIALTLDQKILTENISECIRTIIFKCTQMPIWILNLTAMQSEDLANLLISIFDDEFQKCHFSIEPSAYQVFNNTSLLFNICLRSEFVVRSFITKPFMYLRWLKSVCSLLNRTHSDQLIKTIDALYIMPLIKALLAHSDDQWYEDLIEFLKNISNDICLYKNNISFIRLLGSIQFLIETFKLNYDIDSLSICLLRIENDANVCSWVDCQLTKGYSEYHSSINGILCRMHRSLNWFGSNEENNFWKSIVDALTLYPFKLKCSIEPSFLNNWTETLEKIELFKSNHSLRLITIPAHLNKIDEFIWLPLSKHLNKLDTTKIVWSKRILKKMLNSLIRITNVSMTDDSLLDYYYIFILLMSIVTLAKRNERIINLKNSSCMCDSESCACTLDICQCRCNSESCICLNNRLCSCQCSSESCICLNNRLCSCQCSSESCICLNNRLCSCQCSSESCICLNDRPCSCQCLSESCICLNNRKCSCQCLSESCICLNDRKCSCRCLSESCICLTCSKKKQDTDNCCYDSDSCLCIDNSDSKNQCHLKGSCCASESCVCLNEKLILTDSDKELKRIPCHICGFYYCICKEIASYKCSSKPLFTRLVPPHCTESNKKSTVTQTSHSYCEVIPNFEFIKGLFEKQDHYSIFDILKILLKQFISRSEENFEKYNIPVLYTKYLISEMQELAKLKNINLEIDGKMSNEQITTFIELENRVFVTLESKNRSNNSIILNHRVSNVRNCYICNKLIENDCFRMLKICDTFNLLKVNLSNKNKGNECAILNCLHTEKINKHNSDLGYVLVFCDHYIHDRCIDFEERLSQDRCIQTNDFVITEHCYKNKSHFKNNCCVIGLKQTPNDYEIKYFNKFQSIICLVEIWRSQLNLMVIDYMNGNKSYDDNMLILKILLTMNNNNGDEMCNDEPLDIVLKNITTSNVNMSEFEDVVKCGLERLIVDFIIHDELVDQGRSSQQLNSVPYTSKKESTEEILSRILPNSIEEQSFFLQCSIYLLSCAFIKQAKFESCETAVPIALQDFPKPNSDLIPYASVIRLLTYLNYDNQLVELLMNRLSNCELQNSLISEQIISVPKLLKLPFRINDLLDSIRSILTYCKKCSIEFSFNEQFLICLICGKVFNAVACCRESLEEYVNDVSCLNSPLLMVPKGSIFMNNDGKNYQIYKNECLDDNMYQLFEQKWRICKI